MLDTVLAAIDDANAQDPTSEMDEAGVAVPEALLYGRRMTAELERLFGAGASDVLKIAARGQHIERWKIARSRYPEGRTGYQTWRRDQGRAHGARLAELFCCAKMAGSAMPRCKCSKTRYAWALSVTISALLPQNTRSRKSRILSRKPPGRCRMTCGGVLLQSLTCRMN